MSQSQIALIFFFYGLAFFSMGLAIILELSHCTDERLRHAFRPMATFGIIHGFHEWIEMWKFQNMLPGQFRYSLLWDIVLLGFLSFSFLSLAAFGVFLLAKGEQAQRISLLAPVLLIAIWGGGLLVLMNRFPLLSDLHYVANVWTRYVLGIPAALLASAGLIYQQREFRRAGMARFGRDSLWAAIAFLWYGLGGQTFPPESPIPPSNVINQDLFIELFGFPVQLLRAVAAGVAAFFIIRVLRSFEEETRRKIAELQSARLNEAQRREALRGEMLRQVVSAQEAERQRIARELHDETGQALTALGLGLRSIAASLSGENDRVGKNIEQLEHLTEHALIELQRLIADLRPSHLDDLGLDATLRWYVGEIQKRVPLQVDVSITGERLELSSEVKTTLFRIVQEALTNVIKHAAAESARVEVRYTPDGVSVLVSDDGVGFDLRKIAASQRTSWGLIGMQERASLLGGRFEIASAPGKGTHVQVFIPLVDGRNGADNKNPPDTG